FRGKSNDTVAGIGIDPGLGRFRSGGRERSQQDRDADADHEHYDGALRSAGQTTGLGYDWFMRTAVSYIPPRDEILQAIHRIYSYRMTTTSGGNLSIRDDNGDIWITPAGIDKGTLRREGLISVTAEGKAIGPHRPSSELPFHQEIYRKRPDIRGIVHAHPVALVAFSLVHEVPNTRLFHQSRHVCGEAGFAPYELPGSTALGKNVAGVFRKLFDCVLLENHGAVTGGPAPPGAVPRLATPAFPAPTDIQTRPLCP